MIGAATAMLEAARRGRDELDALVREGGDTVTDDQRRRLGLAIGHLETVACILAEARRAEQATVAWVLAHEASELAHTTVQDLIVPSAGERVLAIAVEIARLRAGSEVGDGDEMRRRLARERLQAGDDHS
jgi:hypothetical protein